MIPVPVDNCYITDEPHDVAFPQLDTTPVIGLKE